jgi:hypothetical protein
VTALVPRPSSELSTEQPQGGDWLADYLEWKAEQGLWGDEEATEDE